MKKVIIGLLAMFSYVNTPAQDCQFLTDFQCIEEASKYVQIINTSSGHGSGVYLGGNLWGSAQHVVDAENAFPEENPKFSVDKWYVEDLVRLRGPDLGLTPLEYCRAKPGDTVWKVGYPMQFSFPVIMEGKVLQDTGKDFITSVQVYPGDSGGALFKVEGGEACLAGIVQAVYLFRGNITTFSKFAHSEDLWLNQQ